MKKTKADLFIEVCCKCPNCGAYLNIFDFDDVKNALDETHNSINCNLEIDCEECKEIFIVTDILF